MAEQSDRIRIGMLHRFDAQDVRSWSGILYFMGRSLQEHVGEVTYLGPDRTFQTDFLYTNIGRANRILKPLLGKSLISESNRISSRRLASFFAGQMQDLSLDVLFAPVASTEIAYLRTKLPIVYLSDITWHNIVNYYAEFSQLSGLARSEGENIERRAIQKAKAVVYPSAWPARTARDHYHAMAEKIFEIPFGANLQEPPTREAALNRKQGGRVELLWVGVDWNRKGGDIAFECLEQLLSCGIDARLTVCGCMPPDRFAHPKLRVFRFLSKHDPEQRKTLASLFLDAHFFVFPTRADATPIVISEASAHGLPVLITDTGGITGGLQNGVNGFTMPVTADGKDYARRIQALWNAPEEYRKLVRSSRDLFEQRLNWDAWGRSMRQVFSHALEKGDAGQSVLKIGAGRTAQPGSAGCESAARTDLLSV